MKKFIEKLQFITHDIPGLDHVSQVQIACEAGAKWIQYRCLSKSDNELLTDIDFISGICDDWGATLIVTDHIHLHKRADIQGFHMEDMNCNFVAIRQKLGDDVTLGGSANTIETLIRLHEEGADYAGLGPFSYTATKPNNFPHIGIEGYRNIQSRLTDSGIELPVLAVGGVTLSDVGSLMETGIYGIAVSSAINQSGDMGEAYRQFYKKVI